MQNSGREAALWGVLNEKCRMRGREAAQGLFNRGKSRDRGRQVAKWPCRGVLHEKKVQSSGPRSDLMIFFNRGKSRVRGHRVVKWPYRGEVLNCRVRGRERLRGIDSEFSLLILM